MRYIAGGTRSGWHGGHIYEQMNVEVGNLASSIFCATRSTCQPELACVNESQVIPSILRLKSMNTSSVSKLMWLNPPQMNTEDYWVQS